MTYQTRMLACTLFLSLFPVALLGFVSSFLSVQSVQEEVDKNQRMMLKQIEYQLNNVLFDLKESSLQIAQDLIVRESFMAGPSPEHFRVTMNMINTLQKYRSVTRFPFGVTLLYPLSHRAYSTQLGLGSIKDRYYDSLVKAVTPKYMGITVISPNTYHNQKDLLIVKPVSIENAIDGIVVLHVDIKIFYEYLNQIEMGSTKVLVIDNRGRIVLSPQSEEIGDRVSSASALYTYWNSEAGQSGSAEVRGDAYSVTSFKSGQKAWTYLAMTPKQELNRKAGQIEQLTLSIVGILIAVWGGIALFVYWKMYSPIRRLLLKFSPAASKGVDSVSAIDTFMNEMIKQNQQLSTQLYEQLPLVQENVILQLLYGNAPGDELLERMRRWDLTFQGEWFYTGIVEIDALHEFIQMYKQEDRTSMMNELAAMIRTVCGKRFSCVTVSPQPGQIAFITLSGRSDAGSDDCIAQTASELRRTAHERFKFTVSVAVAPAVQHLHEVGQGYQTAQEYLGFRYLLGPDMTITRHDVEQSAVIQPADRITAQWYKQILTSLSEGDIGRAEEQFNQMFAALPRHLPDFRMIKGILSYFLEEIDQLMIEIQGRTLHDLLGRNPYTELYRQPSLGETREWFGHVFFPSVKQQLERMSQDKSRRIAEETLNYIHEHFESDFSLQQVAGVFGVSSSQLSRFFKQTTKVNFVDYVIHYRISKAKEWLVYTDMTIKDISDRLRYTTTQNFTRVFKQIVGMPPGKYRTEFRLGKKSDSPVD
ncbi:helix-turn-helix domain-containing protein [Paenibacillus sp. GCM10027626]|uniref:helix-turn-helix domain-containing protein n=1 Tax=Paenibacillus sp. GCM10027626 TaxID=3273411 RepID=UPI003635400C